MQKRNKSTQILGKEYTCSVFSMMHRVLKTGARALSVPSKMYPLNFMFSVVVVLTETDRLTKQAQHALRRTMEKYTSSCRLILCCNSTSKIIPAIRSRCLGIRVAAPTLDEVKYVCVCVCV